MNRRVMQPFKAPREVKDKASSVRQSPRRPTKTKSDINADSDGEEPTEFGLVWDKNDGKSPTKAIMFSVLYNMLLMHVVFYL